jgi:hypothetical protein
MLSYNDPRWETMKGGRGIAYDPRPALRSLENGEKTSQSWHDLWNELYHQGSIGEASYATVPHLVRIHREKGNLDWNLYALTTTIELERGSRATPAWAEESYKEALRDLADLALHDLAQAGDPLTVQATLGFIATAKGCRRLGALISWLDSSEIDEVLERYLHSISD